MDHSLVWCDVGLHLYGFQPYIRNDISRKKTDFTANLLWWGSPLYIVYVSVSRETSFAAFNMGIVKGLILLAIFSYCGTQGQGTYASNTHIVIWYARYIARYIVWSDIVTSRKCEVSSYAWIVVSRAGGLKLSDCYVCQNTPFSYLVPAVYLIFCVTCTSSVDYIAFPNRYSCSI